MAFLDEAALIHEAQAHLRRIARILPQVTPEGEAATDSLVRDILKDRKTRVINPPSNKAK